MVLVLGYWGLFFSLVCLWACWVITVIGNHDDDHVLPMTNQEREALKEEARDMFYHAYNAYMDNAYPADELMPLSCQGRYRGLQPSRGDIDDTMGNFSLTLIDTLDTLVVLGDISEFERAVQLVIKDVSFESDIVVSVFETNIRILGGLLSAHILAEYIQQKMGLMKWYRGELLIMAKDIGYKLTPAFNTTTGIPHARVNLKTGMKSQTLWSSRETCTACAGTMVLEMAALSRLTGDPIFEEKAHRAMDALWLMRHRGSDLMGTVLNVHSGDWIRRDSGVGAGIDSYYEYCLKAYVLLGDNRYLTRFNKHYSAVMKYISQGPMLLDVHMHRPNTNSRNFMDALLAFWPGLQVLSGDLKPAVETHEMLYQVMKRHNFIPEAFTTDFQVHWAQYPLRPEFLESTYFLYKATGDHYYLHVGKKILKGLQRHARVPCGYAAVGDVRTGHHDDRMDSFVLAETFKYLFLLFADAEDLVIDLDKFLFTTEAHLLPLTLARAPKNSSLLSISDDDLESDVPNQCPSSLRLFPEAVRRPLRNFVQDTCPSDGQKALNRRLLATHFQSGNPKHKKLIEDMGISMSYLDDGRVRLSHAFSKAKSINDAKEGLLFMQEMIDMAKAQSTETLPQTVIYWSQKKKHTLSAGPAHFGKQLRGNDKITGPIGIANPSNACLELSNPEALFGRIAIVQRGSCMFIDKARRIMAAGAIGGIVIDNQKMGGQTSPMFAMSGDGTDDVTIPVVFLFYDDAWQLLNAIIEDPLMKVTLADRRSSNGQSTEASPEIEESVRDYLFDQVPTESQGEIIQLSGDDVAKPKSGPSANDEASLDNEVATLPARLRKVLDLLKAEIESTTSD
ncbi:Glycosyl hydrolase family 47 [Nesidiocoris tenuis]|uniref:alpha-1,2-Mannosidase n=1 Tax=Nesidiocoris tenuis TaxID=355587 RepID=A0ABN7BAW4_9HEMI|nr:Glycosyl hydrolase family 47 [Nesidiocoris tenuis]